MYALASYLTIALAAMAANQPASTLESQILRALHGVGLSAGQRVQLRELLQKHSPQIGELETRAAPTPLQLQARDTAVRETIAQNLRGAEAYSRIAEAGAATAEQVRAASELAHQLALLDNAVWSLLTVEQQMRLEGTATLLEDDADSWSGQIMVVLSVLLPEVSRDRVTLAEAARELKLDSLVQLLNEFQLSKSERAVEFVPSLRAAKPDDQTELDQLLRQLERTWRVNVEHLNEESLTRLISRLNALQEIDSAYRERAAFEPRANFGRVAANNPYHPRQEYLNAAPRGIDARYAWTLPHGKGESVGLVDLEQGWNLTHEDFASKPPVLIYGSNNPTSANHGTSALGEAIADDNEVGVIGAAPSKDYVFVTSWYRPGRSDPNIASALLQALPLMNQGDVLQVEAQRDPGIPVEDDDNDYRAIRTAVLAGIIVIEAAGNRGRNLDLHVSAAGQHIFNRASSEFRDSGAIIVGASNPLNGHNRGTSCFGSRVDCFAWGNSVVSCGDGDLDHGGGDPNKKYTRRFNGTSSAVPMIAGAAMLLQGLSKGNSGTLLSPSQMRSMLANPSTGTLQGTSVAGAIGVMPDLQAIIQVHAGLRPTSLPAPCPAIVPLTRADCCPPVSTRSRGLRILQRCCP